MNRIPPRYTAWLSVALLAAVSVSAQAQDTQPVTQPASQPTTQAAAPAELPHITVDREAQRVLVETKVIGRDQDWLELIVCAEGGREHESILSTKAKPSHIHLALILIGMKPGGVETVREDAAGHFVAVPAWGDAVEVLVSYERNGETVTESVAAWVLQGADEADRRLLKPEDVDWVFAGSTTMEHDGQAFYMADMNGTVVSLVNFRDDLIVQQTALNMSNDGAQFQVNQDLVPPADTPVTLILQPKTPADAEETATQPAP